MVPTPASCLTAEASRHGRSRDLRCWGNLTGLLRENPRSARRGARVLPCGNRKIQRASWTRKQTISTLGYSPPVTSACHNPSSSRRAGRIAGAPHQRARHSRKRQRADQGARERPQKGVLVGTRPRIALEVQRRAVVHVEVLLHGVVGGYRTGGIRLLCRRAGCLGHG